MAGESYNTRQRKAILDFFATTNDEHITVSAISDHLRSKNISVGTTTIYRRLERLIDEGIVRKYFIDGIPSACFALVDRHENCECHIHFRCEKCGALSCIECDEMESFKAHLASEHGIKIDSVTTVLYGKCPKCTESEEKNKQ